MQNQTEKNMANWIETVVMQWFAGYSRVLIADTENPA